MQDEENALFRSEDEEEWLSRLSVPLSSFDCYTAIHNSSMTAKEVASLLQRLFQILCTAKREAKLLFFFSGLPHVFQNASGVNSEDSIATAAAYLRDRPSDERLFVQYENYMNLLFQFVFAEDALIDTFGQLKLYALQLIKKAVRHEVLLKQMEHKDPSFPFGFYHVCLSTILHIPTFTQAFVLSVSQIFFEEAMNLQYNSLLVLRKMLEGYGTVAGTAKRRRVERSISWFGCTWRLSAEALDERLFALLKHIQPPKKGEETLKEEKGDKQLAEEEDILQVYMNQKKAYNSTTYPYRQLYQTVWLLYLRTLPRKTESWEPLLYYLPKHVFSSLSNPLAFSEVYLRLLSESSSLSLRMVALYGVFYLLTKHRLGDPHALWDAIGEETGGNGGQGEKLSNERSLSAHFYVHLYHLIRPATFSVARRAQFLRLLKMALFSPLLPSNLLCAFVKKCTRTACLVSPPAALWLVAFVYTLIRKHKFACAPLLHKPMYLVHYLQAKGDFFDFDNVTLLKQQTSTSPALIDSTNIVNTKERDMLLHTEPFDWAHCLPDILQTELHEATVEQRTEFSLWELELLKHHYYPAVAQMAQLFDTDIFKASSRPLEVEDFINITYMQLVRNELNTRGKFLANTHKSVAALSNAENDDVQQILRLSTASFDRV